MKIYYLVWWFVIFIIWSYFFYDFNQIKRDEVNHQKRIDCIESANTYYKNDFKDFENKFVRESEYILWEISYDSNTGTCSMIINAFERWENISSYEKIYDVWSRKQLVYRWEDDVRWSIIKLWDSDWFENSYQELFNN
jgi:hypothetical protein